MIKTISIILSSISIIIIGISAFLLWWQIYTTQKWNRKKATQEVIDNLLQSGLFLRLNHKLEGKYNCKFWDKQQTFSDMPDELMNDIIGCLSQVFNLFENVSISIKNNIIVEDISYDFLGWFFVEYYRWGLPHIDFIRNEAKDPRILFNFEYYAIKWTKRKTEEYSKAIQTMKIEGKKITYSAIISKESN